MLSIGGCESSTGLLEAAPKFTLGSAPISDHRHLTRSGDETAPWTTEAVQATSPRLSTAH